MAYSIQVEPMESDEERDNYDGYIGMTESTEAAAREALREHQEAMGITFEDPDAPVIPTPGTRDENYG